MSGQVRRGDQRENRIASFTNAPEPPPGCLTRMLPYHLAARLQYSLTLAVDVSFGARMASPEMLPTGDLLPHVICSPLVFVVFTGGGGHEAYQHDDTRRIGGGIGGALRPG